MVRYASSYRRDAALGATKTSVEALEVRVYGQERKLDEVIAQVTGVETRVMAAISAVSAKFDTQIQSQRTNWVPVIVMVVAVAGCLGAFFNQQLAPISQRITSNEEATRLDIVRLEQTTKEIQSNEQAARLRIYENEWPKAAQAEYEHRIDEKFADRREQTLRDVARLDQVDANLIKRPEIQALVDNLGNRIDALSRNAEDLRRDFGSNYTVGDQLKSLQRQIETLQGQVRQEPVPGGQKAP